MSFDDHERVSRIFLRAVELPAEKREAYLREVCRDSPGLRFEVDQLLRGDARAPAVLDTDAFHERIAEEVERAPERIGGSRVLDKIGEGGMGVVYRAAQEEPVRRQVAIKLIKRGFETKRVLARFEVERQTLALMSHPCITQVFDAGVTDDGRPYITMEYVDGVPITDYCDAHRLGIPDRLRLFIQVCEGVQYAHQKAILHRDVKPSNILVTTRNGRPLPKIIDFGVAKATERRLDEHTMLTELGHFVGTPEYMSPEQAAMEPERVDTRTDVYALGVVLYELLVGAQPFERDTLRQGSVDVIRRRIREDEAPRPSSRLEALPDASAAGDARRTDVRALVRRLRHDLDWIAMRALEKDPDRRYGSPRELADDVERYLEEEPVEARPPSRTYRAKKFVRKHRVGVAFASTIAVLLLAGAGTLTVQFRRITIEKSRADAAALQAMKKADAARQVSDFLVEVFGMLPDRQSARRQLDVAVEKVAGDLRIRPDQRPRLLYPLGQIYDNLGFAEGMPLMDRSMQDMRTMLGAEDPEVLAAMHTRGIQLARLGRFPESEALMLEVLGTRREVLGEDHRDTIRAMAHLGRVEEMSGDFDAADEIITETLDRSRRVLGERTPTTLLTMGYLANLRLRQGRLDDAERRFREVLEQLGSTLGVEHPNTLACFYKLGCVEALKGNRDQAVALIRRAVDGGWVVPASEGIRTPTHVALREQPALASLDGHPDFEALVGPDGYLAALEEAREAAWDRDFDLALAKLSLAVERGFANPRALLRDVRLGPLLSHPEFRSVVERLREGE